MSLNNWPKAAKHALRENFVGQHTPNKSGYLNWPSENLVPGVELKHFEDDLRRGAGDELRMKFCAIHSSAALAVNVFAHFKEYPDRLRVLGQRDFLPPEFERKCPTGLGGTPPNLDVWLESETQVVAIESKLTEYLTPKKAKYVNSYKRSKLPFAETCWWEVLEESKTAGKRYLDVAQLVKHYLGLIRHSKTAGSKTVTLFYVFWEPSNAANVNACVQHRLEVEELSRQVSVSKIRFEFTSYAQLWSEWDEISELREHVANLRGRYDVKI